MGKKNDRSRVAPKKSGTGTRKKVHYTDEPIEFEDVEDFLPPPDQLVLREDTVKVTLCLSKSSVDFFKKHAAKQRVPYQKMIRRVVDLYALGHRAK